MALVSDNVRVAVSGAVYVAPTTAPAPVDASTAPDVAYKDLGYVHEDGVTEALERSTEQMRAWQNAALVRETVTEADMSYTFRLIESKKETVELFYGGTVNNTDGSIQIDPSKTGGRKSFIIDVVDGDQFIRSYIPSGEITEVGEQVYASGEPVGYEITIKAYMTGAFSVKKFYSALDTA